MFAVPKNTQHSDDEYDDYGLPVNKYLSKEPPLEGWNPFS
jgi:hypothetical protein